MSTRLSSTSRKQFDYNEIKIKDEIIQEDVEQVINTSLIPEQLINQSSDIIVLYPHTSLGNLSEDSIIIEDAVEEVCCSSDYDDSVIISSSDDSSYEFSEIDGSEVACSPESSIIKIDHSDNHDHDSGNESMESDHGYDSIDSPQSEPEQLRQLFPELW